MRVLGAGAKRGSAVPTGVSREIPSAVAPRAVGGGARGGAGAGVGGRACAWWGSRGRARAAAIVVMVVAVAVAATRRWARWPRGWRVEGIPRLAGLALARRWRWSRARIPCGGGCGARDKDTGSSQLQLPKERARLALPLRVCSPLAISGTGGDPAEKVSSRVHLCHAREEGGGVGGGVGGGAGAEMAMEMALCLAEVLVDLGDVVGGHGHAKSVVRVEVGSGGGGATGKLAGICDPNS